MEQQLLPAWSKRRRLTVQIIMTGFVLMASMFIGLGLYQVGREYGILRKPLSRQSVADELINDADFIKAIEKSATSKICVNNTKGFEYYYQSPFSQIFPEGEAGCTKLVALHATGADVIVEITPLGESREVFVSKEVKEFDRVDTSLMNGTHYPTSRLSGIKQGLLTEEFVVGIDRYSSFLFRYAPTDPTLTGKVIGIIESFYSIPQ